jgi:Domain of unknown function (DUF3786)
MPRIDDYKNALEIARQEFRQKDPEAMALRSGTHFSNDSSGGVLAVPFINRRITVSWPGGQITGPDPARELPLQEQVLVMHYLLRVSDTPLAMSWITFREIPSGEFYYSAFVKRAKEPLVKTFGDRPQLLAELGTQMGGTQWEEGDVSVYFQAFPKIPVCLVLWAGDDEFPPDGNILFDASISQFLSAEDVAVLSGMVVYPLVGMAYKKPKEDQVNDFQ